MLTKCKECVLKVVILGISSLKSKIALDYVSLVMNYVLLVKDLLLLIVSLVHQDLASVEKHVSKNALMDNTLKMVNVLIANRHANYVPVQQFANLVSKETFYQEIVVVQLVLMVYMEMLLP